MQGAYRRKGPAACLRVQELFAVCPQVGVWKDAPGDLCLVFVTDNANVDLKHHTMRNVPKKHVGILSGGQVYNYGNTSDTVVSQTPGDFLKRFQKTYGGDQALFFGTFPAGARTPEPESGAAVPASAGAPAPESAHAATSSRLQIRPQTSGEKTDYFARLDGGPEYYVARSVSYLTYRGLHQPGKMQSGPRYRTSDFKPQYETVAGVLGVISAGESSGFFNRLNSYDRAAFTFGFFQLAAHTPNDNLILFFRRLAAENSAFQDLFPELKVVDGVLHRLIGGHGVSLERPSPRPGHPSEMNLRDFMSYLNPEASKVDDQELSVAARLVHLADSDPGFNSLQVNVAAGITMRKMRDRYAQWYSLDGMSDLVCTAIADIHHQGRGTKTEVRSALASSSTVSGKVAALCLIGESKYASRCATLKKALKDAEKDGHLGISVYDKASGLFRPATGWPD